MYTRRFAFVLVLLTAFACTPQSQDETSQESDPQIAQLKSAVDADSNNWQAYVRLSEELRRKERYEEAAQAAQQAFMLAPEPGTEARLNMAKVFAAADQSASAINIVKEIERKKRDEGLIADEVKIAEVYAVLGDTAAVYRWLDRAVPANSPNLATLRENPEFAALHDRKHWQDFVARLP